MIQVSWQPGNGATPGFPGMVYSMAPGQDTTPPLNYTVLVVSGWGGPGSDYTGPASVEVRADGGAALVDNQGNVVQSVPVFLAHGSGASAVRVKVTSPNYGYNYKDVGLFCLLPSGEGGGQSNNLRVMLAAQPPATHTYGITSGGQRLVTPPLADPVAIDQDGKVIWQSGPYTNPITGDRQGSW